MIKSNPTPTECILDLENRSQKFSYCCEDCEVYVRLPSQGSYKGLGNPRESDFDGQWDLTAGFPQDWKK